MLLSYLYVTEWGVLWYKNKELSKEYTSRTKNHPFEPALFVSLDIFDYFKINKEYCGQVAMLVREKQRVGVKNETGRAGSTERCNGISNVVQKILSDFLASSNPS